MFKYLVSLCGWGDEELCSSKMELKEGDRVIVENESGNIMGTVKREAGENDKKIIQEEDFSIIRKATSKDIETYEKNLVKKKEILDMCRKEAKRMELEMKFVDAYITLGKGTIIISFIADGRVDFRQLVRNLSRILHRSVRMHQIGSRDEARKLGGCGVCGKELCCVNFLGEIPSISTEMAKIQQVAQRGSDRISGVCGRLKCCLSYETEQYREMLKGMPEAGSSIKTKKGKGEVMELSAITGEIKIILEDGSIVIIKKEDF
ncbi:MAG: regulatory iron-sulfur-containing complex subunit RicT [Candidatus Moranbacteria bacterium]|nr:regulatory iron-sulfur-containing complex subunit RicT [Candidatus Moranbacteria bacterium]